MRAQHQACSYNTCLVCFCVLFQHTTFFSVHTCISSTSYSMAPLWCYLWGAIVNQNIYYIHIYTLFSGRAGMYTYIIWGCQGPCIWQCSEADQVPNICLNVFIVLWGGGDKMRLAVWEWGMNSVSIKNSIYHIWMDVIYRLFHFPDIGRKQRVPSML